MSEHVGFLSNNLQCISLLSEKEKIDESSRCNNSSKTKLVDVPKPGFTDVFISTYCLWCISYQLTRCS